MGLDPNGDGFLAVRSGPGTNYRKIDELYNGDWVFVLAERGQWFGVAYGVGMETACRSIPSSAPRGWVHSKWIPVG